MVTLNYQCMKGHENNVDILCNDYSNFSIVISYDTAIIILNQIVS